MELKYRKLLKVKVDNQSLTGAGYFHRKTSFGQEVLSGLENTIWLVGTVEDAVKLFGNDIRSIDRYQHVYVVPEEKP